MNCFYCELEPHAGGTRITASTAVAICLECGAGVCSQHSRRQTDGAIQKILCPACAAAVSGSKAEPIRSAS